MTRHVLVYSLCFLPWGLGFASATFLLHWITDYYTSRLTSALWFVEFGLPYTTNVYDWAKVDLKKRSWFFKVIGFDQLIHFISLAVVYGVFHG